MTAHMPQVGLLLTVLRDLWMPLSFLIIIKYTNYFTIFVMLFTILVGCIGFLFSSVMSHPLVTAYGIRDILFFMTAISIMQMKPIVFSRISRSASFFVLLIFTLSSFSVLLQLLGANQVNEAIFSTQNYFAAKGIITNQSGGFFGARLLEPLYSASLVGTLLASYVFFLSRYNLIKIWGVMVSIFTLAKVIPVLLYFRMMYLFPLFALVMLFSVLSVIYNIAVYVVETQPISLYTFHAASILDRFNIFINFPSFSDLILPWPLGYNSVAGFVLNGLDPSRAPESLFLSKIYDLGIWSLPLVSWTTYSLYCTPKYIKGYACAFVFIQFFSSLSNHLVAVLPIIVLIHLRYSLNSESNK